jgi:hypothetical protein
MMKKSVYWFIGSIAVLLLSCNNHEPVNINVPGTALSKTAAAPTTTNNCITPPDGIIAWWPGDGNAEDIIGSNNGQLGGGASFADAKVGKGFSFSGANDVFSATANGLPQGSAPRTVAFWTKVNMCSGASNSHVFGYCTPADNQGFYIYTCLSQDYGVNEGKVAFSGHGDHNVYSGTDIRDGNFHLIAVTYTAGTLIIFIDSKAVASGNLNLNTGISGGVGIGGGSYLNGIVDEVAVWNRALSQTEIQAIYTAGSAGMCKGSKYRLPFVDGGLNQQRCGIFQGPPGPNASCECCTPQQCTPPSKGRGNNHCQYGQEEAIDFALPLNSPVYSTEAGEVIFAGPAPNCSGYGLMVKVRHISDDVSFYAHLSSVNVAVTDKIAKGTQIGTSGNSGIASKVDIKADFNGTVTFIRDPVIANCYNLQSAKTGSVRITAKNGRTQLYRGLYEITVQRRANIKKNDVIGREWKPQAVHLHFEIRDKNGKGVKIFNLEGISWDAPDAEGRPECPHPGREGWGKGPKL